ncbi:hypothetical protein [Bradyrhizobium icense]|uniref:Uncharacterized protein n=1 Tax=Bradyrhizobium icense TaxID=1274631 RepID=A0A1B1UC34_9BRAD|nr:hypothetical protein [Bradyrhizobium icense]ANW00330.1 hypothetical protein LMTR13_09270 [Bradyrhizobium icense]
MERIEVNWQAVKVSLWAGASGMVVGAYLLVQAFGFLSPSKAERLASEKSDRAVVAALAPGCAEEFRSLPDVKERLAALVASRGSYRAKDAFPPELVTWPGKTYVDHDLVRACGNLLLKNQTADLK